MPPLFDADLSSSISPARRRWVKQAAKAAKDSKAVQAFFDVLNYALSDTCLVAASQGPGRRNVRRSSNLICDLQISARRALAKHGLLDQNSYDRFVELAGMDESAKFNGRDYVIMSAVMEAWKKLGLFGTSGYYFASGRRGVGPARLAPLTPEVTVRGVEAVLRSFGWECDGIGKAH